MRGVASILQMSDQLDDPVAASLMKRSMSARVTSDSRSAIVSAES